MLYIFVDLCTKIFSTMFKPREINNFYVVNF